MSATAANRRQTLLHLLIVLAPGVVGGAFLYAGPPLAQIPSYHDFADQRAFLGVPHCLNVLSNLPFLLIGAAALHFVLRRDVVGPGRPLLTSNERLPYGLLFLGVGMTAFGSAYYHLDPNNVRLVWDRLPMALAFMGLFDTLLGERLGLAVGRFLLVPLVLLGLASVWYWQ
jgi:hypothetical protein